MGRLYWKIFLVIAVTQIATTLIVGVLLWFYHPARHNNWPPQQPATALTAQSWPGPRPGEVDMRDRPPPPSWGQPGEPPRPDGSQSTPFPQPPSGIAAFFFGPHGFPWPPTIIGVLASLLFAGLLARHLSRPIMALRRAFQSVAKGDFDVHPVREIGPRRDELAELGHDFEYTARQLKGLVENQRRLLHDVSHEVRSPLARMQLAIDLARQQPEKTAVSMARIERESSRINHLVGELLTLSRLEAGACGAMDEELDIVALVGEIVEDARFEASAVNRHVEFSGGDTVLVRGHGELLQRAIENVVRNAVRHTFDGTTVMITLYREGHNVRIVVEDDGPGVPEAALDAIFEPFVRFREGGNNNDGYGLGLAITRQTIEAHGGRVHATNRPHGGLRMEMSLPVLPAS